MWEASGWLGQNMDQPRFVALASGALEGKQAQIASRSEVCRHCQEATSSSRTRLCWPPSPAPMARHTARLAGRPSHAPESLQVPKAVLAALQGKFVVDLATDAAVTRMRSCVLGVHGLGQGICVEGCCLEARGLTQQGLEQILESGGDAHFGSEVLKSLGCSQEAVVDLLATSHHLATLHLDRFDVPADAWERLGASLDGERFRKVNFIWPLGLFLCLVWVELRAGRAEVRAWRGLQGAAGRAGAVPEPAGPETRDLCTIPSEKALSGFTRALLLTESRAHVCGTRVGGFFSQELVMDFCQHVPATAWAELRAAEWPELRKASFVAPLGLLGEGGCGSEAEGWRGEIA